MERKRKKQARKKGRKAKSGRTIPARVAAKPERKARSINCQKDGFLAMSNQQELTNPGLFATFIVRIEDVSKQILTGVSSTMTERERQSAVDKNIDEIKKKNKKKPVEIIKPRARAH